MEGRRVHGHKHGHSHARRQPLGRTSLPLEVQGHDALVNGAPSVSAPLLARDPGEKTGNGNVTNIVIGVCVAVPVVLTLCVLLYLHRRSKQRLAKEDIDDKYKSLDFGLGDSVGKGSKRKSAFFGGKDKDPRHKGQLSMDMNLSSPYLLPPSLHHSRESMNTLTKTLNQKEDPYRTVSEYASDVGSMRSFPRPDRNSSVYTGKTRGSVDQSSARVRSFGGSMTEKSLAPQSPSPPLPQVPAQAHVTPPADEPSPPILPEKNEFRFVDDAPSRPGVSAVAPDELPTIHEPPAAAQVNPQIGVISDADRPVSGEPINGHHSLVAGIEGRDSLATSQRTSGPIPASQRASQRMSEADPLDIIEDAARRTIYDDGNGVEDYAAYAQGFQFDVTDPDQDPHASQYYDDYRQSAALGVPEGDNRRLSVGMRPLPPDELLSSEDPEFRANRIRSFYKEYFDDSAPKQDAGRPPPLPGQGGYYEDYDTSYMGDAAYFDPETNAFVMPYAEPVHRRAMTPPPNSRRPMPGPRQRGPGPRGPPGPGRQRAGSTMSGGRWAPRSPRPGSSASQPRFGAKPRKPLPPPMALSTLPTPSKLKDDSIAIFNAADFAPPPTFKDQTRGRSQSPMGERVPYRVQTPVHSPLVSTYDETAALPSPHMLRKSGTFTSLDFAPPRRFKDPDAMSDTGSVHSARSGLSSKAAFGIRAGAGRVSRLPEDYVATTGAMNEALKPQWGMRP